MSPIRYKRDLCEAQPKEKRHETVFFFSFFFGYYVFVLQSFRSFDVKRHITSKLTSTFAFTLAIEEGHKDSTISLLILVGIMVRFFSTLYVFLLHGVLGVDTGKVSVSVMEGYSVTLHTGVKTNQQGRIRWSFNDIRIAQINGDLSKICTDVQCNEGTERFRERLKLDHQTGSLTIMNITTTDSGLYKLDIFSISIISENIFSVSVRGVSAVETNEVKMNSVKEGEHITLDTGGTTGKNYSVTWYFNDIRLAYINRGSEIWKSSRRFSNRLQLDHQTGSLSITNIKTTDSGLYKLEITNSSCNNPLLSISSSRVKRFHVSVSGVSDSGLSSAAVAGICVVVLLVAAGALIYCCCRTSTYGSANNNEVNHDRDESNNQIQMEASGEERNETGSENDTS